MAERESIEDVAFNIARRFGVQAGFTEEATRAYVADKIKAMPSHFDGETRAERVYQTAKWIHDNCGLAILHESGW